MSSSGVYVVSQHCEGSGGFDWYWSIEDAEFGYDREVAIWAGTESTIRLVKYETANVPAEDDQNGRDALTAEIDSNLDLVEVKLPAIREVAVS